jgi:hypothetical protein
LSLLFLPTTPISITPLSSSFYPHPRYFARCMLLSTRSWRHRPNLTTPGPEARVLSPSTLTSCLSGLIASVYQVNRNSHISSCLSGLIASIATSWKSKSSNLASSLYKHPSYFLPPTAIGPFSQLVAHNSQSK